MENSVSKPLKWRELTTSSESPSQGNTSSEELGLKPTKADRKKFDLDLSRGEWGEEQVAKVLSLDKDKVEVKTDWKFQYTGNIAIEDTSYGKTSGISATESEHWVHQLIVDDEVLCTLLIPTDKLKKIVDMGIWRKTNGGDHYASTMHLINLSKLFDPLTIEMYSNQTKGDT